MSEPLRGIVLRPEGDTLVVRATEAEVRAYGVGDRVQVKQAGSVWRSQPTPPAFGSVQVVDIIERNMRLRTGEWLYDADGNPVTQVVETSVSTDTHPVARSVPAYYSVRARLDLRLYPDPVRTRLPVLDRNRMVATRD
jgi:hypothetical protein